MGQLSDLLAGSREQYLVNMKLLSMVMVVVTVLCKTQAAPDGKYMMVETHSDNGVVKDHVDHGNDGDHGDNAVEHDDGSVYDDVSEAGHDYMESEEDYDEYFDANRIINPMNIL